jgi:hypothetical protein
MVWPIYLHINFAVMSHGEAMISTIKSNKAIMLNKSKRFRKTLGGYGKSRIIEYDFPKATPQQLSNIRAKIKKETQILWTKVVVVSSVVIIFIIWLYFKLK